MRTIGLAIALGTLFASVPAVAGDVVPKGGMPFCIEKDDLQEFLLAAVKGDKEWLERLSGCGILNEGIKLGIIDVYESGTTIGHVEKVRVFSPTSKASQVGYVMRMETGDAAK